MNAWIHDHRLAMGAAFVLCMGAALVVDLLMVLVFRVKSISLRTWIATRLHPTLIAGGILATVGVGWMVQDSWALVLFGGMMGGHLFVHW